jgi:carbamate kinase
MIDDAGRGWRMVVPSPRPVKIVEYKTIRMLVNSGIIVIAGGGGGIPIIVEKNGDFEGLDAVIDKDFTASMIGRNSGADTLIMATDISKVSLNFNTPDQKDLDCISVDEAEQYYNDGHFLEGSMGPKMRASIEFLRGGGKRVIVASPGMISEALEGNAGTTIVG